jgi:hypothetical protein
MGIGRLIRAISLPSRLWERHASMEHCLGSGSRSLRRPSPGTWRGVGEGHRIETAKLSDVDPQAWLADVLACLHDHPAKRLIELLPWNWKAQKHQQKAAA